MKRFFLQAVVAALALGALGVAQAQTKTIKFANQNAKGHPLVNGMEKFAELVDQKSGGKLKVNVFPGGALGSDQANVAALQGGTLEMASMNSGIFASLVKDFEIYDFPFLFGNPKEADAVVDGPFGQGLHKKLEDKGIVGLAYYELGFRQLTNSKRPIAKAEDLDGLKIRVIPNPVFLDTFKAFKANPVPMPFAELYGALEAKAVDGQENPFSVILSNKFYEVQKFVSATNHVYAANILLVSKRFWDKLSPAEQKILNDAANETRPYQRQVSRAAAQKAVDELKAKGMQYNELAPAELAKMRATAKTVTDKFLSTYDPAVTKLYTDELARIQK